MSTAQVTYQGHVAVPRRRRPAYGESGPPPEVESTKEDAGSLGRRTEAMLGAAIVMPVVAAYAAIGYGVYALVSSSI